MGERASMAPEAKKLKRNLDCRLGGKGRPLMLVTRVIQACAGAVISHRKRPSLRVPQDAHRRLKSVKGRQVSVMLHGPEISLVYLR